MPRMACTRCAFATDFELTFEASWHACVGNIHNVIPQQRLRELMRKRQTGWNTYGDTSCKECFDAGFQQATEGCQGIIKVSFARMFDQVSGCEFTRRYGGEFDGARVRRSVRWSVRRNIR